MVTKSSTGAFYCSRLGRCWLLGPDDQSELCRGSQGLQQLCKCFFSSLGVQYRKHRVSYLCDLVIYFEDTLSYIFRVTPSDFFVRVE